MSTNPEMDQPEVREMQSGTQTLASMTFSLAGPGSPAQPIAACLVTDSPEKMQQSLSLGQQHPCSVEDALASRVFLRGFEPECAMFTCWSHILAVP